MKLLTWTTLIGVSLGSVLWAGGTTRVAAETLVTCGPNSAAYIVKVVPAGCRLLSATSAPTHNPVNTVEKARLGFTFNATKPAEKKTQDVLAKTDERDLEVIPVALW